MSARAEVSASPDAAHLPPGSLRVRPPSPLSARRRAVIAVAAACALVIGAVLVFQARGADGDELPGGAWRGDPVPRAARVDDFARGGSLGSVEGFGAWQTGSGALEVSDGLLRSTDREGIATVDAGSVDVVVHAQVVRMTEGSGLLISSSAVGVPGLVLRARGAGGWELVWQRSGLPPQVLQSFGAPTEAVSVQVIRRGDRIKVAFGDEAYDVVAPSGSSGGTFVGIASSSAGNELDLFGYLPLDPG